MKPFISFSGYEKVLSVLDAFQSQIDKYMVVLIRVGEYTSMFNDVGVDAAETFICNGLEGLSRNLPGMNELIRVNESHIIGVMALRDWQDSEYIKRLLRENMKHFGQDNSSAEYAYEILMNDFKKVANTRPEIILSRLQNKLRPEWEIVQSERTEFKAEDFSFALDKGEIEPYFQPIVGIDGKIKGVEALCRWEHPTLGVLTPDRFLSQLIDNHYSYELFQRNLEAMSRLRVLVKREIGVDLCCSINVDGHLFEDPRFIHCVDELPSWCFTGKLELEVVESSKGIQDKEIERQLRHFRDRGVSLAVDDFGMGFGMQNSYSDLFSTLKLDRSFVSQVVNGNEVSTRMATAIVEAYHDRGGKIVAEGIEEWQQYRAMKDLNVDFVQGFGVSVPLSMRQCVLKLKEIHMQGVEIMKGPPKRVLSLVN